MTKQNYTWFDNLLIDVFGSIGVFGWFFAIWIPEYRWRIFFTCLLSLILAVILIQMESVSQVPNNKIKPNTKISIKK